MKSTRSKSQPKVTQTISDYTEFERAPKKIQIQIPQSSEAQSKYKDSQIFKTISTNTLSLKSSHIRSQSVQKQREANQTQFMFSLHIIKQKDQILKDFLDKARANKWFDQDLNQNEQFKSSVLSVIEKIKNLQPKQSAESKLNLINRKIRALQIETGKLKNLSEIFVPRIQQLSQENASLQDKILHYYSLISKAVKQGKEEQTKKVQFNHKRNSLNYKNQEEIDEKESVIDTQEINYKLKVTFYSIMQQISQRENEKKEIIQNIAELNFRLQKQQLQLQKTNQNLLEIKYKKHYSQEELELIEADQSKNSYREPLEPRDLSIRLVNLQSEIRNLFFQVLENPDQT